jgi:exodeoxyribonuclease VIII
MALTPKTLDCGLHKGIPAQDYFAIDACSNSRLTTLRDRSPMHVRYEIEHPEEPTPALVMGDAVHVALLQPELAPSHYVVSSTCVATKARSDGARCLNPGKFIRDGRWFCGVHAAAMGAELPPQRVLSPDDGFTVNAMCDAIHRDEHASELLRASSDREVTALWKLDNGLLCKGRFDILGDDFIADLKTVEDASHDAFQRALISYGWHRQAAMYVWAAAALGRSIERFEYVVVEKSPPYAVGVYSLDDEAMGLAADELNPLLDAYRECELTGKWPGYPRRSVRLPLWAMRKIEDEAARRTVGGAA